MTKMLSKEWCAPQKCYEYTYITNDMSDLPTEGLADGSIAINPNGDIYIFAFGEWKVFGDE